MNRRTASAVLAAGLIVTVASPAAAAPGSVNSTEYAKIRTDGSMSLAQVYNLCSCSGDRTAYRVEINSYTGLATYYAAYRMDGYGAEPYVAVYTRNLLVLRKDRY